MTSTEVEKAAAFLDKVKPIIKDIHAKEEEKRARGENFNIFPSWELKHGKSTFARCSAHCSLRRGDTTRQLNLQSSYWALQYGEYAEILEPKSLRDEIRKAVRDMGKKYLSGEME